VRAAANGGPGSRVRRPSQGGMRIRAGVAPAAARLESSRYSPIVTSLARLAIRSPHLSPIVTSGSGRLRGFCDSETWIDRGTHVIAGNTCKSPTFAMSSVSRGSARGVGLRLRLGVPIGGGRRPTPSCPTGGAWRACSDNRTLSVASSATLGSWTPAAPQSQLAPVVWRADTKDYVRNGRVLEPIGCGVETCGSRRWPWAVAGLRR
jgi:hypothetical protein